MKMLKVLFAARLGLLAFFCNSAGAVQIPINNPSFESPALGSGQYQSSPLVGWTAVSGQPTFVYWNPGSTYPNSSLTTPPPDGQQVMLLGDNFTPGMITQNLGVNLQPNTTYTLTYWVGSRLDIPRGDYEVRLLADGAVLASDHRGYVSSGIFEQRVISYHSGASGGGMLSIDIRGTGYTNVDGIAGQVLIDQLQLDATPDTLTLVCPTAITPQNAFYSSSFQTVYGQAPFTFSILNGSTGGMTLDPRTGALTGTPPTKGAFTFTGQVTDSAIPSVTATRSCTITVAGLATAGFVKSDSTTQGTWRGVYGADGYMIAQDTTSLPAYAQTNSAALSSWLYALYSTNPSCMFRGDPQAVDRICATWYGNTFAIDVAIAGGPQPVILYALDYEPSNRTERIDVVDAATGTLLDTRTLTNFGSGINLIWNVYGHVQFRVTALAGPNAVVSGVLFGSTFQPSITQNPVNAGAAVGQTATFTVAAAGGDLNYQWQSQPSGSTSFVNIAGAMDATYTTHPLTLADNGTLFRCVVTNSIGTATSGAATLTITGGGPSITQNPSNATVPAGQTATFTVVAAGANLTYQWQSEASGATSFSNISGANSASYTTPVLALSNSGTQFRCVVTGTGGTATSTAATLTVTPPSITQNPSNATVTVGQTATFTVAAAGANLTYQWQSEASGATSFSNISGANSASYTTPVLALSNSGTQFRCVVTGTGGTATSTPATLTVNPVGTTNLASFVATDTSTGGSWKGVYGQDGVFIAGDTTNPPAYGSLSFSGPLTYVWAASVSNLQALQKGSASATDRIASCIYSSTPFTIDMNLTGGSHLVTLYALDWDQGGRVERIDVVDGNTGATLDTRTISGFISGVYLQWNVTGHVQFRVTPLGSENAVVSGIFFGSGGITPPSITQNPTNATVTVGQTATFTVAAAGANLTYQWQSEASGATSFSNISGANSASYTTPVLALSNSGTQFRCVVTGTGGTATSTPATLTVNPVGTTNLASFVATDTSTGGSWKGVYGQDGVFIAGDTTNPPAYGSLSFSGPLTYVWAASVSNLQALQKGSASATDRIASCIYSSTPFTIDVNLTGGSHLVTLYALDWDQGGRVERIDVLDGNTGVTLDTRTISGFISGVYLQWNVTGHVQFRITPLGGANAVVSGIFFGG